MVGSPPPLLWLRTWSRTILTRSRPLKGTTWTSGRSSVRWARDPTRSRHSSTQQRTGSRQMTLPASLGLAPAPGCHPHGSRDLCWGHNQSSRGSHLCKCTTSQRRSPTWNRCDATARHWPTQMKHWDSEKIQMRKLVGLTGRAKATDLHCVLSVDKKLVVICQTSKIICGRERFVDKLFLPY